MPATLADDILERRTIRRRLWRWRVIAVLAIAAALIALAWQGGDFTKSQDHIARIHIDGMITGDQPTIKLLDDLAASDKVKAVIVRIDSPGGTTAGSEAVYDGIRKISAKKPVVAVMDSVAASGGYITAIAADYIVARGNTITGSIGVVFSFPEISRLMDTLGIKMEEIKSGELKAEPTPFKPVSDRVRQVTNEMVMESYEWFVGLVAERRKIDLAQVKILADGRVYSGRQAVNNKLIDALGGEEQAQSWLGSHRQIARDMTIVDWQAAPANESSGFGFAAMRVVLNALGLQQLNQQLETARLDGLLVLWHPQL